MEDVTAGYGFDVILNVSSGAYLQDVSWPLVAPFGRFVELRRSKNALIQGGAPAMKKLSEGATFIPIDIIGLCRKKPQVITRIMTSMGTRYRDGVFASLPHKTLPVSQIKEALSNFGRFEHIGKLVLSYSGTDAVLVFPSLKFTEFREDGSYLVIGPLTTIAIEFIHWMIRKGVRRLVFLGSRRPFGTDDQFIDGPTAAGISVTCVPGSAANINDVRHAMSSRICGIIELTGLHSPEGPDEKTAYSEDDREVTEKANALANLHSVSLEKGYELDFVSILTSTPPASQTIDTSYSLAANRFYWSRIEEGMPCTRIHIGTPFTAEQTLELLCTAFLTPSPPGKHFQGPIYALSEEDESQASEESSCHGLGDARQYVFLNHHKATKRRLASAKENQTTVCARVDGQNVEEIVPVRLSKLLRIPLEKVRTDVSLSSVGIDSMIASEFRLWLQQALNISVSTLELLSQHMTTQKLVTQ